MDNTTQREGAPKQSQAGHGETVAPGCDIPAQSHPTAAQAADSTSITLTAAGLIRERLRAYENAVKASAKASAARAALPAGSSRAKVTTANARWARAAEHREACAKRLADVGVEIQAAELLVSLAGQVAS